MKSKLLILGLLAGLLHSGIASGASSGGRSRVFDVEADCSATPPAAYSASGVTDDGRVVQVDVAVLLDGVKKGRARELFERAASAYAQIGIDLVAASYDRIGRGFATDEGSEIEAAQAIAEAKSFFGGERPEGADVVHLLTNKNLTLPAYGNTPAGVAECAGGVQWPDKAFSVSEDSGVDAYSYDAPGLTNVMDGPSEVIAHEIGHLLGGLHEYKSCVEGAGPDDVVNRDPSSCTIMSDVVDLASLRFGTVEALVVRGYALRFADA